MALRKFTTDGLHCSEKQIKFYEFIDSIVTPLQVRGVKHFEKLPHCYSLSFKTQV